jgi:hypothetical protein
MIREAWLSTATLSELPKSSISSARFSQSRDWFEPARAAARKASAGCFDQATKSSP